MKLLPNRYIGVWALVLLGATGVLLVAKYNATPILPGRSANAAFRQHLNSEELSSTKGLATATAEPVLRRLTSEQYRQVMMDVFGPSIALGGRLEPDPRHSGLIALGSSTVSVTASGFEQYDAMARAIAAQVVEGPLRSEVIPCTPVSATAPDPQCAGEFIRRAGPVLFRRPLSSTEIAGYIEAASAAAATLGSFKSGLRLSLAAMLESPDFLFRREVAEPDPGSSERYRLDAYSVASRLSFFLWNTSPDAELLEAAGAGQLEQADALDQQVDRLLASPRLEAGVRAFFSDMLALDGFRMLTKDEKIYPGFSGDTARDAPEQTLRTIVDVALVRQEDFRDIFTTTRTFLTPELGALYGVPVPMTAPNGAPSEWSPHEYQPQDPRAGVLAQAAFVALHSHPGRSSPTLRGRALRELVFCTKVPDPPANIDFSLVNNTGNPTFKTARERLTVHRNNPICAGCHRITDPMGLALENFDSSGAFRVTENSATIDASGELDGTRFANASGLAQAVHDSPRLAKCLVNRLYVYATGREVQINEAEFLSRMEENFKNSGYQLRSLLKEIAISPESYRVRGPGTAQRERLASISGQSLQREAVQ